ncbi:MAG: polysaccharide biosynthesis protein [Magnetococcus sp. DMHC-6]
MKQAILVVADIVSTIMAFGGGIVLLKGFPGLVVLKMDYPVLFMYLIVSMPIYVRFGLYRAVIRYMGVMSVLSVFKALLLSVMSTWLISTLIFPHNFSISFWIIFGLLMLFFVGGSRLLAREFLRQSIGFHGKMPVAIYGAGAAGVQLATALENSIEFHPSFFVDDNPDLQRREIKGLRVYAPKDLPMLVKEFDIGRILLALPSLDINGRREVLRFLEPLATRVQVMPGLVDLASGKRKIEELQDVQIEDLVGRRPVEPSIELLDACILDKAVLVTGAGGSIGSELCRQIIQRNPSRLVLVERSEVALYSLEKELRQLMSEQNQHLQLVPILGSILNRNRMRSVISSFGIQTLYHAAAYKHVPIVERNPIEGVENNTFGTLVVAQAAIEENVETFVLISTDKAVRPTNVMGASKRFAELILQGLADQHSHRTRFIMVRFGNVLASSGSVVPLFYEQIRQGGPVTVTDPGVVRFFMTIPEAAQLVIQAGAMGQGGDVFVLEMGEPIRILDLAIRMIHFSGLRIKDEGNGWQGDIEIQITGLREGEKLYEELVLGENIQPTEHPKIMRAQEAFLPWAEVDKILSRLERACLDFDYLRVRRILLEAVEGYQPSIGIKDWVWISKHVNHSNSEEGHPHSSGGEQLHVKSA